MNPHLWVTSIMCNYQPESVSHLLLLPTSSPALLLFGSWEVKPCACKMHTVLQEISHKKNGVLLKQMCSTLLPWSSHSAYFSAPYIYHVTLCKNWVKGQSNSMEHSGNGYSNNLISRKFGNDKTCMNFLFLKCIWSRTHKISLHRIACYMLHWRH